MICFKNNIYNRSERFMTLNYFRNSVPWIFMPHSVSNFAAVPVFYPSRRNLRFYLKRWNLPGVGLSVRELHNLQINCGR